MSDGLWPAVLGEIELSVSRASFVTWFKNTTLLKQDEGKLTVGVPNIFTKRQFEDKFNRLIMKILKKNGVDVRSVHYEVHLSTSRPLSTAPTPNLVAPVPNAKPANRSSLNDRYNFDSFVVGASNELAYAAAQAIAREPGTKYNPFFVYGGAGLGKTHLIQAIGNEIRKREPEVSIEYVTSERFKNEFVASILSNNKTFFNKYRTVDVLIVDDMQFIAGEKTQEEFFHTFNALYQNNKQIIMSSDKPPKAIPGLAERLRSRFEWGMNADIQAPDFETRLAIIQSKAAEHNTKLPSDISEYLANHIQANIRELEGALTKLLAHCEMRQVKPTLELVQQMVSPTPETRQLSARQLLERTARFFNVSVEELLGPKRDREIVEPRQVAMYLMRTELHLSFPQVAKQVGRSDHSTAMHSVDKIERAVSGNHYLRAKVLELKEKLYA